RFAMLANYVYSGEVLFPVEIAAPRTLPPGAIVTLGAQARWLACSDVCVPEQAELTLTLPVAAQGRDDPNWAPRVAAALPTLPQLSSAQAHITAGDPALLSVALASAETIRNPHFFPYSADVIDHAAPEHPRFGPTGLSFYLKAGVDGALGRGAIAGVVA